MKIPCFKMKYVDKFLASVNKGHLKIERTYHSNEFKP